jgi:hypothetical protein
VLPSGCVNVNTLPLNRMAMFISPELRRREASRPIAT